MSEQTIRITVESLTESGETFFSPVTLLFHDGTFDTFNPGEAASEGIEFQAEDGNGQPLLDEIAASGAGFGELFLNTTVPTDESLFPVNPLGDFFQGESDSIEVTVDSEENPFFSYAVMFLPSNDAFFANDDPQAFQLFDEEGNFVPTSFIINSDEVYDAGTEVNDEIPENSAFVGPTPFDSFSAQAGVDEGGVIELHPGYLTEGDLFPEGNILGDPNFADSASYFSSALPIETRPSVPIARFTVELVPEAATVTGTDGDDLLLGGIDFAAEGDTILAGAGDDEILLSLAGAAAGGNTVLAGSGDDTVFASSDDTISGGDGDDTFFVEGSGNSLLGGAGDDTFFILGDDNVVSGGAGDDTFSFGAPGDVVSGNTVSDFVAGEDLLAVPGSTFADLEFVDSDILLDGVTIATLAGVDATTLAPADFGETDDASVLAVDFADITLPETIAFGDTGSATIALTNTSDLTFVGDVDLSLLISTDDDIDSESDEINDAVLAAFADGLELAPGASTEIALDYESNSGVIAPGSYHLLAEVEGGELASELVSSTGSNAVQVWHALALNAIQEFGETDNDPTGIGIEPTVGSRALAIVQTSVFNAVNAFEGEFESYLDLDPGTPVAGASDSAAAVGASVAALGSVLPGTEDLSSQIIAQLELGFGLSTAEVEELLIAAGVGDILDAPEGAEIASFYDPFLGFTGEDIEAPAAAPASVDPAIFDGFIFGINAAVQVIEARSTDGFTGFFEGLDDPATYVPPGAFEEYIWIGEPALLPDETSVFVDEAGESVPFALSPGWGSLESFTGSDILDFYTAAGIDENGDGLFLEGRPFPSVVDPTLDLAEFEAYIEGLEGDGGPDPLGGAAAVFLGGEDQEDFGVREYGALFDTEITEIARGIDETEIAIFWAYDRADTFRPYGQLHQIAEEATYTDGDDSLIGDARTLALTAISLGEAAIAAWFAKYDEVQSRPDDVIAGDGQGPAIAGFDGSLETLEDPDFEPLLPSPPFPDFLSGHSTFAGAFGGTLNALFPEVTDIEVVSQELVDNGVFTTSDDEAFNELFPVGTFGQVRTFDSYLEVGFEDAISRVYGGVHVQEATDDAVLTGIEIGEFVAETFLQPVA